MRGYLTHTRLESDGTAELDILPLFNQPFFLVDDLRRSLVNIALLTDFLSNLLAALVLFHHLFSGKPTSATSAYAS